MSRTTGPAAPTGGSGSIAGSDGEDNLGSGLLIAPVPPGLANGGRPSPGEGCGEGSGESTVPPGEGNRRGISGDWAFAPTVPISSVQTVSQRVAKAILRARWGTGGKRFMDPMATTTGTGLPVAWRDPDGQARHAGRL